MTLDIAAINEQGKARVSEWVLRHAKHPARHQMGAWYEDAERASCEGGSIILEMPGLMSATGNPVILVLDRNDFDWSAG